MDKKRATDIANQRLYDLIKNQPGLIQFSGSSGPSNYGKETAQFCADFVDTYAAWLIKNDQEER